MSLLSRIDRIGTEASMPPSQPPASPAVTDARPATEDTSRLKCAMSPAIVGINCPRSMAAFDVVRVNISTWFGLFLTK
jgi:hypothetical protein